MDEKSLMNEIVAIDCYSNRLKTLKDLEMRAVYLKLYTKSNYDCLLKLLEIDHVTFPKTISEDNVNYEFIFSNGAWTHITTKINELKSAISTIEFYSKKADKLKNKQPTGVPFEYE